MQNWTKKGLIFSPETKDYASVPIAENLNGDFFRIYFSGRDNSNRSYTNFYEIDIKYPEKIININENPILKHGRLGSFDENGAMGSWIVKKNSLMYLVVHLVCDHQYADYSFLCLYNILLLLSFLNQNESFVLVFVLLTIYFAFLKKSDVQKHDGVHNLKSSWMQCANLYFPFRNDKTC